MFCCLLWLVGFLLACLYYILYSHYGNIWLLLAYFFLHSNWFTRYAHHFILSLLFAWLLRCYCFPSLKVKPYCGYPISVWLSLILLARFSWFHFCLPCISLGSYSIKTATSIQLFRFLLHMVLHNLRIDRVLLLLSWGSYCLVLVLPSLGFGLLLPLWWKIFLRLLVHKLQVNLSCRLISFFWLHWFLQSSFLLSVYIHLF